MKQTAVEWLVKKLSYETSDGTIISHHFIINKLVEQAKEMEKEQSLNMTLYDLNELSENHAKEVYSREDDETHHFENRKTNFEEGFKKALELLTFKSE